LAILIGTQPAMTLQA